jgi:hypothetical protein
MLGSMSLFGGLRAAHGSEVRKGVCLESKLKGKNDQVKNNKVVLNQIIIIIIIESWLDTSTRSCILT